MALPQFGQQKTPSTGSPAVKTGLPVFNAPTPTPVSTPEPVVVPAYVPGQVQSTTPKKTLNGRLTGVKNVINRLTDNKFLEKAKDITTAFYSPIQFSGQQAGKLIVSTYFKPKDQEQADIAKKFQDFESLKKTATTDETGNLVLPKETGKEALKRIVIDEKGASAVPFLSGAVDVKEMVQIGSAYKRLENGTADEYDLMRLSNFVDESSRDKTRAAQVAGIVSGSLAFGGELLTTAGVGAGAKAVSVKATKEALEKILTKEGSGLIKKKVAEMLLKKEVAPKVVGGLVKESIRAPIAGALRTGASTLRNMLPQVDWTSVTKDDAGKYQAVITQEGDNVGHSLTKALGETYVETLSERAGDLFGLFGPGKIISDVASKTAIGNAFLKVNRKLGATKAVQAFNDVVKKAGWNGIINEMLEERVGDVGYGILSKLGLSDQGFRIPSKEDLLTEFIAFSIPGTVIGLTQTMLGKLGGPGDVSEAMDALNKDVQEEINKNGVPATVDTLVTELGFTPDQARVITENNLEVTRETAPAFDLSSIGNEALTEVQDTSPAEPVVIGTTVDTKGLETGIEAILSGKTAEEAIELPKAPEVKQKTPDVKVEPQETTKEVTLKEPKEYDNAKEFIEAKHPTINWTLSENDGDIRVSKIVVPQKDRGQGMAMKAMEDLIKYADFKRKQLLFTPSNVNEELDETTLKDLGFVENTDSTIKATMVRAPQNTQDSEIDAFIKKQKEEGFSKFEIAEKLQKKYKLSITEAIKKVEETTEVKEEAPKEKQSKQRQRFEDDFIPNGMESTTGEIKQEVKNFIDGLKSSGELDGLEFEIQDIEITGSRSKGVNTKKSDLDVLVQYTGEAREDDLFNALNENNLEIDGVKIDINPINESKTGTIDEYIESNEVEDGKYAPKKNPEEDQLEDLKGKKLTIEKGAFEGVPIVPALTKEEIEALKREEDPKYKLSKPGLTLKTLDRLGDRKTISKQFIADLARKTDIKKVEKDLIERMLTEESGTVDVEAFKKKVVAELLPLQRESVGDAYEPVSLPPETRGDVDSYEAHIYNSPIKTSAGDVHFGSKGEPSKNYFGHTRTEDIRTGESGETNTRRVIEVQSDLYQKEGLEKEMEKRVVPKNYPASPVVMKPITGKRLSDVKKLQQYTDPTAHFRMVREEIKTASQDEKTKLQFPTGETAMKIEGLGSTDTWGIYKGTGEIMEKLSPDNLVVGKQVAMTDQGLDRPFTGGDSNTWIVTDILEDGKFKAIPKSFEEELKSGKTRAGYSFDIEGVKESFDISGKVDNNNPIYKFYENTIGKYLKNKYGAELVTDGQGITWWEVKIIPEMAGPVEAFKLEDLAETPFDRTLQEVQEGLNKIFGRDIPIEEVFNAERELGNPNALAQALKSRIRLLSRNKNFSEAIANHEGWHWFKMQLSLEEQAEIREIELAYAKANPEKLEKIRKVYEGIINTEAGFAEELMADTLADYTKTGKTTVEKIKVWFDKLILQLKLLFSGRKDVLNMFRDIKDKLAATQGNTEVGEPKYQMSETNPLFAEARKYKSAEEFVNARGIESGVIAQSSFPDEIKTGTANGNEVITLYHATSDVSAREILRDGYVRVGEGLREGQKASFWSTDKEFAKQFGNNLVEIKVRKGDPSLIWHDNLELEYLKDIKIEPVLTKSQLTDFYNKAVSQEPKYKIQKNTLDGINPNQETRLTEQEATPLIDKAVTRYWSEVIAPEKEKGKAQIIGADDIKDYFGQDYNVNNHPVYSGAAAKLFDRAVRESNASIVKFTIGGTGSGKSDFLVPDMADEFAGVIYDSTGWNYEGIKRQIDFAKAHGKTSEIYSIIPDLERSRAYTFIRESKGSHPVTEAAFARTHASAIDTVKKLINDGEDIYVLDTRTLNSIEDVNKAEYLLNPIDLIGELRYTEEDVKKVVSKITKENSEAFVRGGQEEADRVSQKDRQNKEVVKASGKNPEFNTGNKFQDAKLALEHVENRVGALPVIRKIKVSGAQIPLPEDLVVEAIALESEKEFLETHPATPLKKYVVKTGEFKGQLPEATGATARFKNEFSVRGDDIVTELGFENSEEARESFDDYKEREESFVERSKEFREKVKEYKNEKKDEIAMQKLAVMEERKNLADEKLRKDKEDQKRRQEAFEAGLKATKAKEEIEQKRIRTINSAKTERVKELGFWAKLIGQKINPLNYTDKTTQNIFNNWNTKLLQAEVRANVETDKLKDIPIKDGMDTIFDYEIGKPTAYSKRIKDKFDSLREEARKRGVDLGFRENYLPHVYAETSAEVREKIRKYLVDRGLSEETINAYENGEMLSDEIVRVLKINPFFSKERVFPTYKIAMEYGLTPKYTTVQQLVGHYVKEMETIVANNELVQELESAGKILPFEDAPVLTWQTVNLPFSQKGYMAPPPVARVINGLFGIQDPSFWTYLAKLSKKMQEIALSAGIPYTTINFFAIGQLIKEVTAGNFKATNAFFRANFNRKSMDWLQENRNYMYMMARQGVNLRKTVDSWENLHTNFSNLSIKDTPTRTLRTIFTKDTVFSDTFDKLFNKRTFMSFMPMMQIQLFKDTYNKFLEQGYPEDIAEEFAGRVIRNNFGLTKFSARSKEVQDKLAAIFFAPQFREGIINTLANTANAGVDFVKNVGGLREPISPTLSRNRKLLVGMMITYALYNLLNAALNDDGDPENGLEFMWDNPKNRKFALQIPTDDGTLVYVEFMPSFLAFARNMFSGTTGLLTGDIETATQKYGSLLSMPIKLVSEIFSNKDYFGNPIYNETDTGEQKVLKIAQHAGLAINHPYIKELVNQLQDKKPLYQSLISAFELPLKFSSKDKVAQGEYYDALDKKAKDNARMKEKVTPVYEQVQVLKEEGRILEATDLYNTLSEEEKIMYSKIKNNPKERRQEKEALFEEATVSMGTGTSLGQAQVAIAKQLYGPKPTTTQQSTVAKDFAYYRIFNGYKYKKEADELKALSNENKVLYLKALQEKIPVSDYKEFVSKSRQLVKLSSGKSSPVLISDEVLKQIR